MFKEKIVSFSPKEKIMLIILSILGIFIGFLSGFFAIGGGTMLVPALLMLGYDIKYAIGISVTQMVFSSLYGSYLNHKKGTLNFKSSIAVGIGGFLGAANSGYIVSHLSSHTLTLIFLSFVFLAIYKFFKSPNIAKKEEIDNNFLLFFIGYFVGTMSISVGIGGALLITPILVGFLHFPLKKALSSALFFVIFSSVSGFVSLAYSGFVHYKEGLLVGTFSLIGVYFGIKLSHKTEQKRHKKLLLIFYLIIMLLILKKLFYN